MIAPPSCLTGLTKPATLSLHIRDQGGGVSPPSMTPCTFSLAFTIASRCASSSSRHGGSHKDDEGGGAKKKDEGTGASGGPYAAQYISAGAAAESDDMGAVGGVDLLMRLQTGLGTITRLGFGLPVLSCTPSEGFFTPP